MFLVHIKKRETKLPFMKNSSLLDSELQYFLRIAKGRTLLSAAEDVGLSQPALSRAMTRLEDKLGFKLFKRSRNGVELTEEGEKLLLGVKDFNADLSNLVENIRNNSTELSGELT